MDLIEVLLDSLLDCLKLAPFLLLAVFLVEYVEHRAAERFSQLMAHAGRYGPFAGALLGVVPQCGFSASCAQMFNNGLVSAGTLVAVFLSTSDEAIPVLLANPGGWRSLGPLLLCKLIVSIGAGLTVDALWRRGSRRQPSLDETPRHACTSDGGWRSLIRATLTHTLSLLAFLFLFTFAISLAIAAIGEARLARLLLPGPWQPVVASVIGLIPNCAASVLLAQLYADGMISFGSAVSGLCAASGVGILVLLRGKRGLRVYAWIVGACLAFSVLAGSLLQLLV